MSKTPMTMKHFKNIAGCDNPECRCGEGVLYLHALCHPESGTEVSFDRDYGVISVRCGECKETVVDIKVAAE